MKTKENLRTLSPELLQELEAYWRAQLPPGRADLSLRQSADEAAADAHGPQAHVAGTLGHDPWAKFHLRTKPGHRLAALFMGSPNNLPVELWIKCTLAHAGQETGICTLFASSGGCVSQCCTFMPVWGHLNMIGRPIHFSQDKLGMARGKTLRPYRNCRRRGGADWISGDRRRCGPWSGTCETLVWHLSRS